MSRSVNRKHLHKVLRLFLLFMLLASSSGVGYAQQTVIRGRITDSETEDPVSRANVALVSHSSVGTITDFEGFYEIKTRKTGIDSIRISVMGYESKTVAVQEGQKQEINVRLKPATYDMEEAVITPGKPAYLKILEKVWKHRDSNNREALDAYQYESYSRTELAVNNISEDFKKRTFMKPFRKIFDSMQIAAGKDGSDVLPVFISETMSTMYHRHDPDDQKEVIHANNVTGVGLEDGSFISQFVGASFQQYNFYNDWLTIITKHFVSPIGKKGPNFYEYRVLDTQQIDGYRSIQLQFKPKRKGDLAFSGTFWITDSTYALKRMTAETDDDVNVNFIDRFKIEQSLRPTDQGPWVPAKTRVLIDVTQVSENTFSFLGKFYISNEDIEITEPKDQSFYSQGIDKTGLKKEESDSFWKANRHTELTSMDKLVFNTIDSIRNIPVVQTYTRIIRTFVEGYWDLGQLEVGPYWSLYGYNTVEGSRFRMGARTDEDFSEQWIFKGHLAYGTRDQKFKYNLQAERFLSRESWTKIGFQHKFDLKGLGSRESFFQASQLFQVSSQIGLVDRFNLSRINRLWIETDLFNGFTQRAFIVTRDFQPRGDFTFAYQRPSEDPQEPQSQYQTTAISLESRYAPEEKIAIDGNQRVRLESEEAPVITARYTAGLKGFLNGDFAFQKASLQFEQDLNMGRFGRSNYLVRGKKIFDRLPYTLLNILPGNETFIRSGNTYNLMNFFEFVGDETLELSYRHHFEGLLLNRVPLLSRTDWRLVSGGKAIIGDYNDQNDKFFPENNNTAVDNDFKRLDPSKPYAEVSYGIENILTFFRIEAIHRLTYVRGNDVDPFGVRGSLHLNF